MNKIYFYFMNALIVSILTSLAVHASAQSSGELSCRSKAKEIAVQTYSSCMTEARNTQIEDLRRSYKEDLANLKNKYEQEMKKMGATNGGGKTASKKKSSAPTVKEMNASKPTKGIARSLPTKKASGGALPIHNVSDETKVVAVDASDYSSHPVEQEAASADRASSNGSGDIEIIDMPVVDDAAL